MRRSLAVTIASCALLAAGCGGSSKPASTPVPSKTVSTAAVSPATPTPDATEPFTKGCAMASAKAKTEPALRKPSAKLDPAKTYVADVSTNCGDFQITLDAKRAPKTGGSFKYLADKGFYDGVIFHRIIPGFVIQAGDPTGKGTGGPGYSIVEKPPAKLVYAKYVVAMAKTPKGPSGSSGSQFFVSTGKLASKLPSDYALLGRISGGQDVVDRIGAIQTDPRSDAPEYPIVISKLTVSEQ
jgi:peptidyl-prolyl cis-trans isomerase B (cyclophilin B)